MPNLIQPGDVFVKRHGKRELVQIFLPQGPRSAKNRYMRLSSGAISSTWVRDRNRVGSRTQGSPYQFVGTVPLWFLNELLEQPLVYIKQERYAH